MSIVSAVCPVLYNLIQILPSVQYQDYLSTQLEVDHHYRNLGNTAGENQEDQKQETKQVVELVFPDSLEAST